MDQPISTVMFCHRCKITIALIPVTRYGKTVWNSGRHESLPYVNTVICRSCNKSRLNHGKLDGLLGDKIKYVLCLSDEVAKKIKYSFINKPIYYKDNEDMVVCNPYILMGEYKYDFILVKLTGDREYPTSRSIPPGYF